MDYKLKKKEKNNLRLKDITKKGTFFRFKNDSNTITSNLDKIFVTSKVSLQNELFLFSLDDHCNYSYVDNLNEEIILIKQTNTLEFEEI